MQKKASVSVAIILGLFAVGFIFSTAKAQRPAVAGKSAQAQTNKEANPNKPLPDGVELDGDITVNETSLPDDIQTEKNNKGQANAANHRSAVATFVQGLLSVADREGGIGPQVRVIAQEQNDSKEKVAKEIEAVESRSKIKTFFLGSDYKNLGDLRSEMARTRNQIDQLIRLSDKAESPEGKADLQKQIMVLQQEQAKIQNFITDNESQFSLFGWAVKLFQ